jgi:hypothetical protein
MLAARKNFQPVSTSCLSEQQERTVSVHRQGRQSIGVLTVWHVGSSRSTPVGPGVSNHSAFR